MSSDNAYLVGLRLAGKKVVVVGGGSVAQRRLGLLVASGADVRVVARSATPAVEAMSGVTVTLRDYRDGDLEGAWYAIAATDDADVNAAVAAEAERRRIFCVRSDVAVDGSAVTPATFAHAGLAVGVLAAGDHRRSAGIRTAIREALAGGLVTEPEAGADENLRGTVALVGGGPGDPELITVRGRRLLSRADVVVADRLAPQELLSELPAHVEVIDAAKIPYGRAMAQEAINAVLVDRARGGAFVVRLKGGDPFVFARGYEEVLALADAGIPVSVVPGVTSAIAVPALAGVPVTHRSVNHEFTVVSGHCAPGAAESLVNWDALAAMTGTIVLLMGVERIELFAEALIKGGRPAQTPVLVVQQGSTPAQRTVRSSLAEVAAVVRAEGVRPPAIIVIGPVVGLADEMGSGPHSTGLNSS